MTNAEFAETLTSFADGEAKVRRATGWSDAKIKDRALDLGIEKCLGCGWWAETGEMLPTDAEEPDGHCANCRPAEDEEGTPVPKKGRPKGAKDKKPRKQGRWPKRGKQRGRPKGVKNPKIDPSPEPPPSLPREVDPDTGVCAKCGKKMEVENTSNARYTIFVLWKCACGFSHLQKKHLPPPGGKL